MMTSSIRLSSNESWVKNQSKRGYDSPHHKKSVWHRVFKTSQTRNIHSSLRKIKLLDFDALEIRFVKEIQLNSSKKKLKYNYFFIYCPNGDGNNMTLQKCCKLTSLQRDSLHKHLFIIYIYSTLIFVVENLKYRQIYLKILY